MLNEVRWNQVLDAAEAVFFEKGFGAASIQDVANRAGLLNKSSLYHYIETKEDLLFALIERSFATLDRVRDESDQDARVRI